MLHFLQKKIIKKIRNKGTINVLQGGRGSAEYGHIQFGPTDQSLASHCFWQQWGWDWDQPQPMQ